MSAAQPSDGEFTKERCGRREGGRGGEMFGGKRERDNPEMSPYFDGNISSLARL